MTSCAGTGLYFGLDIFGDSPKPKSCITAPPPSKSMPRVFDLCARVQNGFRARLQAIAVPENKMNLAIANILYHEGFISSVARGNHEGLDEKFTLTTSDNVATRRLWLTLKYKDGKPVLNKMSCVSKPSKRIILPVADLKRLTSDKQAQFVDPLQPGEIMIVSTTYGVLEIHEAMEKNAGGEVLCRVW